MSQTPKWTNGSGVSCNKDTHLESVDRSLSKSTYKFLRLRPDVGEGIHGHQEFHTGGLGRGDRSAPLRLQSSD